MRTLKFDRAKSNWVLSTIYGLLSIIYRLSSIVFFLFLSSCNTPEKLLCRTWRLVDAEFDESSFNLTAEQKPKMIQQLRDSCVFTFNKKHTYQLKLPQNNETGVWNFSAHHDTLFTQNDHTGAYSKINVLSKIAFDIDIHARDGSNMKFILTPEK